MRTMIAAAVLAAAVFVPAAASAGPPAAAAPPAPAPLAPAPLAPDGAAALAAAPGVAGSSLTRSVSPQEAFAAASLPGEIVSLAPGLSVQQATGLAAAAVACSANDQHWSWGTWPYEQKLSDTTYWCAVYGDHITYTASTPGAAGTLCGPSWTSNGIVSGGIGYSWFVERTSAGWTCPTVIPWVSLHPSHHLDVSRNAWGSTEVVGSG